MWTGGESLPVPGPPQLYCDSIIIKFILKYFSMWDFVPNFEDDFVHFFKTKLLLLRSHLQFWICHKLEQTLMQKCFLILILCLCYLIRWSNLEVRNLEYYVIFIYFPAAVSAHSAQFCKFCKLKNILKIPHISNSFSYDMPATLIFIS